MLTSIFFLRVAFFFLAISVAIIPFTLTFYGDAIPALHFVDADSSADIHNQDIYGQMFSFQKESVASREVVTILQFGLAPNCTPDALEVMSRLILPGRSERVPAVIVFDKISKSDKISGNRCSGQICLLDNLTIEAKLDLDLPNPILGSDFLGFAERLGLGRVLRNRVPSDAPLHWEGIYNDSMGHNLLIGLEDIKTRRS